MVNVVQFLGSVDLFVTSVVCNAFMYTVIV